MKISNKIVMILLPLIFGLGIFIRIYKLDQIPPSLNWDETAAGYNAWTIFHWGKDEWGNKLPLVFTSFRDDKHPIHIYFTAPFVGILGLNEFATRFPAALISSVLIVSIFFLAKKVFKSELAALLAAFFLAISPYHIHYSRGLWEVDFALFFFISGLALFYYGLEKPKLLYFSFFCLGLSLYSYHASKIVVLPVVFLLIALYFKNLWRYKKHFIFSVSVFVIFLLGFLAEPRLLGLARVNQTSFAENLLKETWVYKNTNNISLSKFEIAAKNYPAYFNFKYLFEKGDQNPRGGVKVIGQLYKLDAVLVAIGLISLLLLRSRLSLILISWLLLAPLPAALTTMGTNSTRAMFMMGVFQLLSALGAYTLIKIAKKKYIKYGIIILILLTSLYEFSIFARYYFTKYAQAEAIEWQYGMKEVVKYVERNPQFHKVYMTSIRQQPYIFFLYYLKTPLPQLLKTVRYDETIQKSANTVSGYDRYQFGGWDIVESTPDRRILYIVQPGDYIGLRLREMMDVPLLVKYPNGGDAFFLVTGN